MIGGLDWVQTGEEMIREGSDRHISWVMDRQTWLERGIDVISQLYSIHLPSRPGHATRNNKNLQTQTEMLTSSGNMLYEDNNAGQE